MPTNNCYKLKPELSLKSMTGGWLRGMRAVMAWEQGELFYDYPL